MSDTILSSITEINKTVADILKIIESRIVELEGKVDEKSSVLGLRKFIQSELQEQREFFYIIEKAVQYLMSKQGIAWSLDGVYVPLEDKEETNE